MASAGPFYFAWVDPTDTTFGLAHQVEDEAILSATIEHPEGDIPSLTIEIVNPRIGLLNAGRKIWAWFSWNSGSSDGVEPLFFGRLLGLPTNIIGQVCTLKFVAQSLDFLEQKQRVAETLKVAPFYDRVFLDPAHADDPDSILEGYSALWHFDRTTLAVSVSDYLIGEDGEEVFTEDDSFYDGVSLTIGQAPLTSVNVDATVAWTQTDFGIVPIGQRFVKTATGSSLISEWPKPESSIGGGWEVHSSRAVDTYGTDLAWEATFHQTWESKEDSHLEGDTISWDFSATFPDGQFQQGLLALDVGQGADLDPFNPDFKDITTAWERKQYVLAGTYGVATSLVLRYNAARARTERLIFTLQSNLQQVLSYPQSPPLPSQETISRSGQNVGERLIDVLDWLSVKGQAVEIGQVIYPNSPTVLGGTSYQMCTTAGTCGSVQPTFSPVLGETTNDNGVIWTSLGNNLSSATPDWAGSESVSVGTIIRPLEPLWATWADLNPPPNLAGGSMSIGEYCYGGGALQICTLPGTTGLSQPAFGSTWGSVTQDGDGQWTCTGSIIPDGTIYYVCIQAGVTDEVVPPPWNPTLGAEITDGTVIWRSLGDAGRFVDIPIGDVAGRSYFPTPRGLQSVEYLICLARAKLIKRARCAEIKFPCRFERAIALSCRKTARLYDHRIPGGTAAGKITGYTISANGDSGELIGNITMMSAVGFGGTITTSDGTPTYVEVGYVDPGYQYYASQISATAAGDVGYTAPADAPNDDGLIFPLTRDQVVLRDTMVGSFEDQAVGINAVLELKAKAIQLGYWQSVTQGNVSIFYQSAAATLARIDPDQYMRTHEFWYELDLKPVNTGPFNGEYTILTTQLEIPQQIDLTAPASP